MPCQGRLVIALRVGEKVDENRSAVGLGMVANSPTYLVETASKTPLSLSTIVPFFVYDPEC